MANVPRGPVLIQSVQTRLFVGRSEREDHSLNPKPIITLYPGTQAPQVRIFVSPSPSLEFLRFDVFL
jgi:hypothetical protein